jgi:DnaJ like chaperone protein
MADPRDNIQSALQEWLRERARRASRDYFLGGLITLLASAVILVATCLFLVFLLLFLPGAPGLDLAPALAAALAVIGFLFLVNQQVPRTHPAESHLGTFEADLVLAGPRLAQAALRDFRRSRRLAKLDLAVCSQVLVLLLERGRKVPFIDLARKLPVQEAQRAFSDLEDLDGVVKLHADPAGLSLTADLRWELRHMARVQLETAFEPFTVPPSPPPIAPPSPEHALFGLSVTATLDEIKAAYRLRMKQYHPDRYADRGEEWRKWAEEKTKALNAAYEKLLERHESQDPSARHQ